SVSCLLSGISKMLFVVERIDPLLLQFGQCILHRRYLRSWMSLPDRNLPDYPKWLGGAERSGRISGKFFIGQIWVIFDRPRRFYEIDPFFPLAQRKFSSPDRGIQGR